MNDINKLTIENFQSHEHTVLEFGKGLNVITGPSDQGKSAIIRALKWVLYNEPRGIEFIRQGAATARVSIEMGNGYTIVRERSKSRNKYTVMDPNGVSQTFEGFGNEVPEEVVKAHGIPKVILDKDLKSSLNIADQLEGPFLLTETGAVRAKAIGRLTGVHIIDNATRECMIDIRRENQTEDRLKNELDDISAKIEAYEFLPDMEKRLKESEKIIDRLGYLIERKHLAENIRDKLNSTNTDLDNTRNILGKLGNLNRCESIIIKCNEIFRKLSSVRRFGQSLNNVKGDIRESEELLKSTVYLDKVKILLDDANNKSIRKKNLEDIYKLKNQVNSEALRCNAVLDASKGTEQVESITKILESGTQRIRHLKEIREKYSANSKEIIHADGYLKKTKDISKLNQIVSKAQADIARLIKLSEVKQQYDAITNYINDGERFMGSNKKQTDELLERYLGYLKVLGKCPLCGSAISDSKLEDIIKHYEEVH